MENTAIIVNDVVKNFKIKRKGAISGISNISEHTKNESISALNKISFTVQKGEILGIIGLNGSGKSTLLRIIAGVYSPDSGNVKVNGTLSPLLQLGVGFQNDLNARENIIINGMLLGLSKNKMLEKVTKIINFAELKEFSNLKIKHYSTGMKARLAFSIAMEIDPDILLVDEILSVGDIDFQKKSYEAFLTFKKNKKTILHASHNLNKLLEFSDRILLLQKGKIIMIGNPEEVIKKYKTISQNT